MLHIFRCYLFFLLVDVEGARRRRDSVSALESYFRKHDASSDGQSWFIESKNVSTKELVGEGAFAKVYKGQLKKANNKSSTVVAVKATKSALFANHDQIESLKKEFEVLAAISGPSTFHEPRSLPKKTKKKQNNNKTKQPVSDSSPLQIS